MEIRRMSAANEDQIKSQSESFFDLGITSQKAAVLLNYLFQYKLEHCASKRGYYYNTKTADSVNGGGLLVKGKAQITINDMNEVGIYFRDHWAINKYVRVASGKSEVIKSIKDKMGNELKKLWKMFKDERIVIDIKDHTALYNEVGKYLTLSDDIVTTTESGKKVIIISLNEYRALYEFLKSREPAKIKERYGTTAYNTMVGQRIEDQFLLSAIDVIKNEIRNVEHEYSETCKRAEESFNESYKQLREKRDLEKAEAEKAKLFKIEELNQQMKDLLNSALGMAVQ